MFYATMRSQVLTPNFKVLTPNFDKFFNFKSRLPKYISKVHMEIYRLQLRLPEYQQIEVEKHLCLGSNGNFKCFHFFKSNK